MDSADSAPRKRRFILISKFLKSLSVLLSLRLGYLVTKNLNKKRIIHKVSQRVHRVTQRKGLIEVKN